MPLKRVTAQASHSLWHKSDITLDSSPQIPRVETFCPKMGTFCQVILLSFGSGIVLLAMQLRFTRDQKSVFVTGLGWVNLAYMIKCSEGMQEQLLTRTSVIPTITISSSSAMRASLYISTSNLSLWFIYGIISGKILLIAEPGVTANLLFNVFILKCKWQLTVLMWFYLGAGNCPPDTLPCTLQREQAWAWWHPATHKPLVLHVGYCSFLPCVVCIPISFQRV